MRAPALLKSLRASDVTKDPMPMSSPAAKARPRLRPSSPCTFKLWSSAENIRTLDTFLTAHQGAAATAECACVRVCECVIPLLRTQVEIAIRKARTLGESLWDEIAPLPLDGPPIRTCESRRGNNWLDFIIATGTGERWWLRPAMAMVAYCELPAWARLAAPVKGTQKRSRLVLPGL